MRNLYSFYIDPPAAQGLKTLKARDGVPESETLRRALAAYLRRKGVLRKQTTRRGRRASTAQRNGA